MYLNLNAFPWFEKNQGAKVFCLFSFGRMLVNNENQTTLMQLIAWHKNSFNTQKIIFLCL